MNARLFVSSIPFVLLAGCDVPGFGPEDSTPGHLVATFQDLDSGGLPHSVAGEFEGSGEFKEHYHAGRHPLFSIWSFGTSASEGESVIIRRYGGGLPSEGSYRIDLYEPQVDPYSDEGFTGQYVLTRDDGVREAYFLIEGSVEIQESKDTRVRGTFDVTGVLWCTRFPDGTYEGCEAPLPKSVDPEAPRTRASGSFVVTPQQLGKACPTVGGSGC
jgi:hypothetical protein